MGKWLCEWLVRCRVGRVFWLTGWFDGCVSGWLDGWVGYFG